MDLNSNKLAMSHELSGDGTSSYLWSFDPWQKVVGNEGAQAPKVTPADFIYKMTPLAKIIFVLRNPTNRSRTLVVSLIYCSVLCTCSVDHVKIR